MIMMTAYHTTKPVTMLQRLYSPDDHDRNIPYYQAHDNSAMILYACDDHDHNIPFHETCDNTANTLCLR